MDSIQTVPPLTQAADPAASPEARPKTAGSDPQRFRETAPGLRQDIGIASVKFSYEMATSGTIAVKVLDGETGKVIREIPPSELLALADMMKKLAGIMLDARI